jgi:hypothetical protein
MSFNKGFAKIKELIDASGIEYNDLEVVDRDNNFVGGVYILIGAVPVIIQFNDPQKKYVFTIESIEGNAINAESTNKQIVSDLLNELAKG